MHFSSCFQSKVKQAEIHLFFSPDLLALWQPSQDLCIHIQFCATHGRADFNKKTNKNCTATFPSATHTLEKEED